MVVLRRYRFPDDYNFEHEGEDEAEFQEFRKELKTIFNNIAMLVRGLRLTVFYNHYESLPLQENDLTVSTIDELARTQLANWRNLPANDVELAVSLVFFLGDTVSTSASSL